MKYPSSNNSRLNKRTLLILLLLFLLACGGLPTASTPDETPVPPPSPTDVAAAPAATQSPISGRATESDQIILQSSPTFTPHIPTNTPTTTPEPPPTSTFTPSATPSVGIVAGQITFRHQTGELRPDTDAIIELVGNTTGVYFTAGTNSEGRYTLNNIPPGQYWAMARSSIGTSNPQEVAVNAGETAIVDLKTFIGFPVVDMRPAGGHVQIDGQPVAGAKVWRFGGWVESNKLAVTDASGYFSFPYLAGSPVIAVSGDRWTITTLQPNAVIDIELNRTGPHPTPPDGPVVTPVPINEDVVIVVPTPRIILSTPLIPQIEVIVPTRPPVLAVTPIVPGVPTLVLVQPTLAQPTIPPTPIPTPPPTAAPPPIPSNCGQSKSNIDYGPVKVGAIVVLGKHEAVKDEDSWHKEMEEYVKQKAKVTELAGVDSVGCPLVRVNIDDGRWLWRIRALTLIEP